MRFLTVLFFVLGFSILSFSQEMGEEIRDGQRYKIHVVEAGNTLYGLHVKYKVSIEEIIEANPTTAQGLQPGMKLYIPYNPTEEELAKEKRPTTTHKVKRKETLFGISKMYDCTVEDLLKLNPEVEKEGLKNGQEILVPASTDTAKTPEPKVELKEETTQEEVTKVETKEEIAEVISDDTESVIVEPVKVIDYKIEFTDSIVEYTVQKGETLYSLSKRFMVPVEQLVADNNIKGNNIQPGQTLKIKLKKERITEVEGKEIVPLEDNWKRPNLIREKDQYKVLVALPMRLHQNPNVLSGTFDENTRLNALTELSVSFLMGAQMALDSLEKLGINANVEFYDTDGNLSRFKEYLGATNSKKYDLIIGPFYPQLVEYAAEWALTNKVPVVAVTKIPANLLENNPYVISTVPSDLTLIGGMAKYLAENHADKNIILVEGTTDAWKKNVSYFRNAFQKHAGGNASLRSTNIGGTNGGTLAAQVEADKDNYFVCLTDNVQHVMQFVNALNAAKNTNNKAKKAEISMVGLSSWRDITTLNSYYKNRFEYHFAASNYLDYDEKEAILFTEEFRSRYGSDPTRYAFHGFDVMLSQMSHLLLGLERNKGIMDHFDIKHVGSRHGSENSSVFITKQKDFEYHLLKIISAN